MQIANITYYKTRKGFWVVKKSGWFRFLDGGEVGMMKGSGWQRGLDDEVWMVKGSEW